MFSASRSNHAEAIFNLKREVLEIHAGLYGMNFENMRELGWRFGYALTLAVITVACLVLYRYVRRIGWI